MYAIDSGDISLSYNLQKIVKKSQKRRKKKSILKRKLLCKKYNSLKEM